MEIGYACLAVGVQNTSHKSCIAKNITNGKLQELISHNINSLNNIIEYNIKNQIKLFRISSDLIPFGSSTINSIPWWEIYSSELKEIGDKIRNSGMRVSMHPGQYTVLNSPEEEVVKKATLDLEYHNLVLDCLGVSSENKIVLHIGGVYNDKEQAIQRFITNYQNLSDSIKNRLVIENDDKSYNIAEILEIGKILNIPVIFDNLHNKVNPSQAEDSEVYWIDECSKTWKEKDGNQKIHYSEQNILKRPGGHSSTIKINEFIKFYESLSREDIDIMLEVKDKNLSAVKCKNCISKDKDIKELEAEWIRYKYKILENSKEDYLEIENLLSNKKEYPSIDFYNIIEECLKKEGSSADFLNATMDIWEYIKDKVMKREKERFLINIESFNQGIISKSKIKNNLWRLALQYNVEHILDSYYFVL
jgi:UV DNA damage endonuclease